MRNLIQPLTSRVIIVTTLVAVVGSIPHPTIADTRTQTVTLLPPPDCKIR